jgi:hypothetical protein
VSVCLSVCLCLCLRLYQVYESVTPLAAVSRNHRRTTLPEREKYAGRASSAGSAGGKVIERDNNQYSSLTQPAEALLINPHFRLNRGAVIVEAILYAAVLCQRGNVNV